MNFPTKRTPFFDVVDKDKPSLVFAGFRNLLEDVFLIEVEYGVNIALALLCGKVKLLNIVMENISFIVKKCFVAGADTRIRQVCVEQTSSYFSGASFFI